MFVVMNVGVKVMTREDTIRLLKFIIEIANQESMNEENSATMREKYKFRHEIYKTHLKLLQLPQRTIDNLEVGDYIEYVYESVAGNNVLEKDIVEEDDVDWLKSNANFIEKPTIIPHQAITLLQEILGGKE